MFRYRYLLPGYPEISHRTICMQSELSSLFKRNYSSTGMYQIWLAQTVCNVFKTIIRSKSQALRRGYNMSIWTAIDVVRIKTAWWFVKIRGLLVPGPNSMRLTTFPPRHQHFPGAHESRLQRNGCHISPASTKTDVPPPCRASQLVAQETCWEKPPHWHMQTLPCWGSNLSKNSQLQHLAQIYLPWKKNK